MPVSFTDQLRGAPGEAQNDLLKFRVFGLPDLKAVLEELLNIRTLLTEKAHSFQIVVFTCRPGDYLLASALVSPGSAVHADTDGGFIRAFDLGRVLRRR